jgi:hypothetical protein
MKIASAHYPMMSDLEISPRSTVRVSRQSKSTARPMEQDRAKTVANVAKGIVIVAAMMMMYCVISYGRIFQNYQQW